MFPSRNNFAALQAVKECKRILNPLEYAGRVWHILFVLAGYEADVGRRLQEQQIPFYFPRIRCQEQQWGNRKSQAFFPGLLFAALTEGDKRKLAHSIFIDGMKENRTDRQIAMVHADIQFMVIAERLNCFYPFENTKIIPPPPACGIPGYDFVELRGEHGQGYILLLPGDNVDQVFFRFDSIKRKIVFEIQKNLFIPILNLK